VVGKLICVRKPRYNVNIIQINFQGPECLFLSTDFHSTQSSVCYAGSHCIMSYCDLKCVFLISLEVFTRYIQNAEFLINIGEKCVLGEDYIIRTRILFCSLIIHRKQIPRTSNIVLISYHSNKHGFICGLSSGYRINIFQIQTYNLKGV